MPHYDTLVFTLYINSFNVHRVLVDPGSAAVPAFKQMKLSLGVVNSAERILSSFNGATTITLGYVALPVKVGSITQQVLFPIVKDLGPYNAIIGQSWLHSMKAIPLTYHQKVSYLTNIGKVDLLSNQLVARQCYQLSAREQRGKKSSERHPLEDQTSA